MWLLHPIYPSRIISCASMFLLYPFSYTCSVVNKKLKFIHGSVFDKLIWRTTIGTMSFLFGTAQFSLWASGVVYYDYIVTNSINSLLIGSRCIPNGTHTNHCWANLTHDSKFIKTSDSWFKRTYGIMYDTYIRTEILHQLSSVGLAQALPNYFRVVCVPSIESWNCYTHETMIMNHSDLYKVYYKYLLFIIIILG